MINFKSLTKSVSYALHGIKDLWQEQQNFRIHIFAAIIIAILSYIFQLSRYEFIFVMLLITSVIITEIFNSNIENILNLIIPEPSNSVKHIKDTSAAAVLIVSLAALIVGLIIFTPHVLNRV